MVVVGCDYLAIDVQMKVRAGPDESESITFCLAVALLCFRERTVCVCDDLPFLRLLIYLRENGCQASGDGSHGDFCVSPDRNKL